MTAQIHEKLILNGERTTMMSTPSLPIDHPRLNKLRDRQVHDSSITRSSACWRKYLGTWELTYGKFYLVHIEGIFTIIGNDPIFADWFSGELRIPDGEVIQYAHMGFHSLFEEDTFIRINEGIVVGSRIRNNRNSLKE